MMSEESSLSLWQRMSVDFSHAFQDWYGNWMLGDEAGQSANLVVIVNNAEAEAAAAAAAANDQEDSSSIPPRRSSAGSSSKSNPAASHRMLVGASLGVTFCDINGRAYVQTVVPGSRAHQAGVRPKDCVQYAAVLAQEWKDPLGDDYMEIQQHALEREVAGQRISYPELKDLLYYNSQQQQEDPYGAYLSPTVPTTIRVGGTNPCGPLSGRQCSGENEAVIGVEDKLPAPPTTVTTSSSQLPHRPIVLVFRRTHQRPSQSLPIFPHFRLDDECDVACQILQSLADTTAAVPLSLEETAAQTVASTSKETVEASTIRGMIQKAHGLAFLRSNKVVLGVSVHLGSGIVLARLSDGTWSAPSAIGVAGMGVGLQLGVEVAHSILILQTPEALEHFMLGGSFTVGANVGAAMGGMGREAIGAASLSGAFCGATSPSNYATALASVKDDEYHVEDSQPPKSHSSVGVAPLVAYAKSQGLYVGISLEGSRIHGRDDVNARTYQFHTRKAVTAQELLTGKVAPPKEAEALYAALHQVEFTHELSSLPRPPPSLWTNLTDAEASTPYWEASYSSSLDLSHTVEPDIEAFEQRVRNFLYGGVHVCRVRGRKRERRTLWLYVPEGSASLQLGFVSKLSNVEDKRTSSMEDDRRSVTSEDVTLDSALMDNQSVLNHPSIRTQVELSRKHSVALTDVVSLAPTIPSDWVLEDAAEGRRVIHLETAQQELAFVAQTDEEAQVLVAGLKLLLEMECQRCNIRGGVGKDGSKNNSSPRNNNNNHHQKRGSKKAKRNKLSGYASSEVEDNDDDTSAMSIRDMPEGWRSWGRVPGRNYLRGQASANDQGYPQYVHGQLLVRDIAKNVHLPLPLPLCRVLLLDSSSPVITQWEKDRGDVEFEKTPWTFPPATPREGDQYRSEHQLIASGSMCGAHRTISYQRPRNSQLVRLFETQIVDSDDSEKLAFQIHERMPRRGFSIKVKIMLRAYQNECEATVLTEIRPVGKNMSNPEAVHKAFFMVLDELRERYGPEGHGLLAGFMNAVNTFKEEDLPPHINRSFQKSSMFGEEKKEHDVTPAINDSKSIKLEDMLKANANLGAPDAPEPKFLQDRTPSPMDVDKYRENYRKPKPAPMPSDTFDAPASEPVMIEVKPLPKIRLSLMPSPREEDEFNSDDDGDPAKSLKSGSSGGGSNSSKSKRTRKSWGKKRRSRKGKT